MKKILIIGAIALFLMAGNAYMGFTMGTIYQVDKDFRKVASPQNIDEYNEYVCHELNTLKRPIIVVGYSAMYDIIVKDGNGTLHYYSQSGITNALHNTYAKGDTINGKGTNIESPDVLIMDAVVGDYSYEELARKIKLSKN